MRGSRSQPPGNRAQRLSFGNFKSLKMNTTSINSMGHSGKRDRGSEGSRAFRRVLVEKSLYFGKMHLRQYVPNCSLKIILRTDQNLTPSSATGMPTPGLRPAQDFQHDVPH